jgi:hypothetical protein
MDGPQSQQHVQKVGNPRPFQNSYVWSRRGSPHSICTKIKIKISDNKNKRKPNGNLFKLSQT